MGFQLKENEYYLIRQIIEGKKPVQFKLHRTNEESVIKFTRVLAGTVVVYIYNNETNQRIDMTKNLGRLHRPLDEFKELVKCTLKMFSKDTHKIIKNVWLYEDMSRVALGHHRLGGSMYFVMKYILKEKTHYEYIALKEITYHHTWISPEYEEKQKQKIKTFGNEYEKFIGQKYESLGQNVVYHGLNKGKKDNGIDLIIDKEDSITFVQCKNWKSMGHYKLNQKDLRAFIGDCYMYMFNNNIDKKHNFHFIVSDQELLTKSAEIYVKENRKLKYKVIPFEE